MKKIELYTDGACSRNPGPGGWGAVLLYKGAEKQISGYAEESTNNRMELTAVLMGLCALKEPCEVTVYTDSAYISNAFHNGWTLAWERNGWINSQKKPVENQDLWISLLNKVRDHKVTFVKVKGHADNHYNNICDKLATGEIKKHAEKRG